MDDQRIASLINLVAAVFIFGAAITPIAYNIWKRANTTSEKERIINKTFNVLMIVLYLCGWVWYLIIGLSSVVVTLFFGAWIFQILNFVITKGPITRQSIVYLVMQTAFILMTAFSHLFSVLVKAWVEIAIK